MRTEWDNFQLRTKVWWDKHKIPYEVLNPADVRKAFPVMSMDDITAVLYEPDAGVVRARRSAQAAAAAFEALGGKIVIGRATPGKTSNGKLDELCSTRGRRFAPTRSCLRWARGWRKLSRTSREETVHLLATSSISGRRSTTSGHISESSELQLSGVTGWAALPVDNRGFRVRGAERAPGTPGSRSGSRKRRPRRPARDAATQCWAPANAVPAAVEALQLRPALRLLLLLLQLLAAAGPVVPAAVAAAAAVAGARSAGRRPSSATGSRHERPLGRRHTNRRLTAFHHAPLSSAEGCAGLTDARLSLRVDVERQLHHRPAPADAQRMDRRGRKLRGIQDVSRRRGIRRAAGHRSHRRPCTRESLQDSRKGLRSARSRNARRQHAAPGAAAAALTAATRDEYTKGRTRLSRAAGSPRCAPRSCAIFPGGT